MCRNASTQPARGASRPARRAGRVFHELRHFYASLLIDGGESVKAVQARLGHATAEETLNTYAHLWPESEDRAREAVDRGLGRLVADRAEGDAGR